MIILLIVSVLMNVACVYAIWNVLRKNELLEDVINDFYARLSIALHTMRALDERQIFEKDDEVGSVFSQIVDVINELRPLIYGSITTDGQKENETR